MENFNSRAVDFIVSEYQLSTKKVLDIGCGRSQFLGQFGEGSVGITTDPQEIALGASKGFTVVSGNAEEVDKIHLNTKFGVLWANNLFEHLLSPHAFLMRLKKVSDDNTLLVLGVPVIPFPGVLVRFSKFRGSLASNHINFFTRKSLMLTVERAGWTIVSARPWMVKNKVLDILCSFFAPHIYVVARNNPQFTYPSKKLAEWHAEPYYKDMLEITRQKSV